MALLTVHNMDSEASKCGGSFSLEYVLLLFGSDRLCALFALPHNLNRE